MSSQDYGGNHTVALVVWGALLSSFLLGVIVGLRHAWRIAWLGLAGAAAMWAASWFASNDPVSWSTDLSWKRVFVGLAVTGPALFYAGIVAGFISRRIGSHLRHLAG